MSEKSQEDIDTFWMSKALEQAVLAAEQGEVPVGAILVKDGEQVAAGFNRPISTHDPTRHAEVDVLRRAAEKVENYRLPDTTMYVTIEPCTMCVGAIIHARVGRLVFGAREPRAGAIASQMGLLDQNHFNHRIQWSEGVLAEECGDIIKRFFRERR